jgi:hypothetical protein
MLPHFRQGFSWKSLINELVNIVRSDTGLYFHDGQGNSTDVGFEMIIHDFSGEWEFSVLQPTFPNSITSRSPKP